MPSKQMLNNSQQSFHILFKKILGTKIHVASRANNGLPTIKVDEWKNIASVYADKG